MKARKSLSTILASVLMLASCGSEGTTSQATGDTAQAAPDEQQAQVEEVTPQTITIDGDIDHTQWTGGVESTITFEKFPKSVAEFESAMEQLGQEPQGAVVLMLMAMELYHNDAQAGEQCLEMINTETNLPGVMRQLKEKLQPKDPKDSYARPYLVATFLEGATPDNGYNPTRPYKVKVRTHPVNKYEKSDALKGYVLELQVYSNGYDTPWRGVQVLKAKGDTHYRVFNCPSMYTACKEINWETDAEFKGLE